MHIRENGSAAHRVSAEGGIEGWLVSEITGTAGTTEATAHRLQRRNALLCGIALTALTLGLMHAREAQAASVCTTTNAPNNGLTVTCTGTGTGGAFTAPGELSLTLDGATITSPDTNAGISAQGGAGLTLTTTGTASEVKGGPEGLYLKATGGNLTINDTAPGTFTGYGNAGIDAISSLGKLTADDFKSTGVMSPTQTDTNGFGLEFLGHTEVSVQRFSGTGTNHGKGDGVSIKSEVSSVTANTFSGTGTVDGEGAGIRVNAATDIFFNQFSGSGSAGAAAGQYNFSYGVLLNSFSSGSITADNFSGSGTAASTSAFGYGVRLSASNGISIDSFSGSGTVTGTGKGAAISINAGKELSADNFSGIGQMSGVGNGIEFNAGTDIQADNFSGQGSSTSTNTGVNNGILLFANGKLTANDFSGIGKTGEANGSGISFNASGELIANRFSGAGTNTSGGVGLFIYGFQDITADNFTGEGKSVGNMLEAGSSKGVTILANANLTINDFSGTGKASDSLSKNSSMGLDFYAGKTLTANNFSGNGSVSNATSKDYNFGINLESGGNLIANYFSGTGKVSDSTSSEKWGAGIRLAGGKGIELNHFSGEGTFTGGGGTEDYGIYVSTNFKLTADDFSGIGKTDGNGADAIFLRGDTGLTANSFTGQGTSTGGGRGIELFTYTELTAADFSGTGKASGGDGVGNYYATGISLTSYGDLTAKNFTGKGTVSDGDSYLGNSGIAIYADGVLTANDFSGEGTVSDRSGAYGSSGLSLYGGVSLTADNFSGKGTISDTTYADGSSNVGISISSLGDISLKNFSGQGKITGSGTGAQDFGLYIESYGGNVTANEFRGSGTVESGTGIYMAGAADITINAFSGTGTTGAGGRGISVVAANTLTANDFSGTGKSGAADGSAGIYLEATGDLNASRFSGEGTQTAGGTGIALSAQGDITADHFSGVGKSTGGTGADFFAKGVDISSSKTLSLNDFSGQGRVSDGVTNYESRAIDIWARDGVTLNDFSGSGTVSNQNSARGNKGIRVTSGGNITANNFSGTGTVSDSSSKGGALNAGVYFFAAGNLEINNFSGEGSLTDNAQKFQQYGINLSSYGTVTANAFSGTGKADSGIGLYITGTDITLNTFSGTGTAASGGSGIEVVATKTLTADDFSGSGKSGAANGSAGIYLEATGDLSALRFSGSGTQTAGGTGIALSAKGDITADHFSGVGKSTGGDGTSDAAAAGIDIVSHGKVSLNAFSGEGTVSDGVSKASSIGLSIGASGSVTANDFSGKGSVSNQTSPDGNFGIVLSSNGKVTANNFSGSGTVSNSSSDEGSADAGIYVAAGDLEFNQFSGEGSVTGNAKGALGYGLYLSSTGTVTANDFSGTGKADAGAGLYIAGTDVELNDFSGKAISNAVGPAFAINATGKVEAKGFVGSATAKEGTGLAISTAGPITFSSGTAAEVSGGTYGFKAESTGGDGTKVDVTITGGRFTGATKDALTLNGPTVTLTATGATLLGGTHGVSAEGNSVDLTLTSATVAGDADHDGTGGGIKVDAKTLAGVHLGAGTQVTGSGKSADAAVISLASASGTTLDIAAGALVTSWAYDTTQSGLVTAASDLAISATGGAATITNSGTVLGRLSLTDKDDTFANLSSNTFVTIGTNQFGAGTDALNNTGRVVTALNGAVGETTSFLALETFTNGDPASKQAGILTMIDETPGQIAASGTRDRTYVSGVFNGVGNSTVGVDAYLGGTGSTSDVLAIGGLDVNGTPISGLVTTGQTALLIHDVGPKGGAYNPGGIKVVDVQDASGTTNGKTSGAQASFVISPQSDNYSSKFGGVIDKGLFFYDLQVIGNDQYLIGVPNVEPFQLPELVTGAQSVWDVTTGVWLSRQADLRTYLQGASSTLITKEGVKSVNAAPSSVTPGVWGKVVGDWGSRDTSASSSAGGASYAFNTSYAQNTYGFLAGADFGREGVGSPDGTLLFGVLGGYLSSNLTFDNSLNGAGYSGGTVGAYATYLNANWFIDALVKADFLSMDYTAPTLRAAGYLGQSVDARNLGVTLDTGYRVKLGETAFFEPLATFSYVNTTIDNLAFGAGTYAYFGANASMRAAVGARVGLPTWNSATVRAETSLTGRFWYEFAGNNTVTLFNPGTPFIATDTFDGAFGEVAATLNVFGKLRDWNGFTTASVKFGDKYTAGTAQAGVRYQW